MKKSLKLLVLLLFIPIITWAQKSISGKIIDTNEEGIPFVTVVEDNTSNGTTTDEFGNYTRPVDAFRPNYVSGWIQDKYAFDDLVFKL